MFKFISFRPTDGKCALAYIAVVAANVADVAPLNGDWNGAAPSAYVAPMVVDEVEETQAKVRWFSMLFDALNGFKSCFLSGFDMFLCCLCCCSFFEK